MIQDWEHHELRRARRDLYHLSHEVALREAHASRQSGATTWLAGHDFRALALLADAVVLELAEALGVELEQRRGEASGSAVAAFANLCDKATWAAGVLRLRP